MVLTLGLGRENLVPVFLRIVQDEGNEIDLGLFAGVARCIRLAHCCRRTTGEELKEVLVEEEAQQPDDNRSADPEMHAAQPETSAASATLIAAIFKVAAGTAW